MAVEHEHVRSWTSEMLSRVITERTRQGLPTLVIDRRVGSDDVSSELETDAVGSSPGGTLDLAQASRWVALIVPNPSRLQRDLQSFARALTIWCAPHKGPGADYVPDVAEEGGRPRITDIVKVLYDAGTHGPLVQSIGDENVRHWRSALRDLGEGPRAVVDNPWFSHLFLSPTSDEFLLVRPYTRLDLRSPRVPRRAAQQIAAVVFDRLLAQSQPNLVCLILEGRDLEGVLGGEATSFGNDGVTSSSNIRLVWIEEVDDDGESAKPTSAERKTSPQSDDDQGLYEMFSYRMDRRHRTAYIKGIMYGYSAFCTFENLEELPGDLVFLREAGLILGMSSPLVELFDDD